MTDTQYEWLKTLLGTRAPSHGQADEKYEQLRTMRLVAMHYLQIWLTEMIDSVTSFGVAGAINVTLSENIKALERLLLSVSKGPDDPTAPGANDPVLPTMGIGQLVSDFEGER